MKLRCAIPLALVAGLFAGCSTTTTRVALPLTHAAGNPLVLGNQTPSHGWMLPAAKSMDLLYVSNHNQLLAFSYPKGKLVGEITVASGDFFGLCSDSTGDVFVTSQGSGFQSYIYEYAHGGIKPFATLSDPGDPLGCAFDPTTGNVAVTNISADDPPYYRGDVVVFPDGQGPPTQYSDSNVGSFLYCSYDATGDLFADGDGYLTELSAGGQSLNDITLGQRIDPSSIQWVDARRRLHSFRRQSDSVSFQDLTVRDDRRTKHPPGVRRLHACAWRGCASCGRGYALSYGR